MLYLTGTPIGNMGDISPRAAEALASADVILCEDTRVTGILLSNLGISGKNLISYHEHNKASRAEKVLELLASGQNVVQVSDAGMPVISDPGEDLVRIAAGAGFEVTCIPGPTAAMTAAALSGIDARYIHFEGFLPSAGSDRKGRIAKLSKYEDTIILYEAPHRIDKLCEDLIEAGMGDRKAAFCRELTKKYEEVVRVTLAEAREHFEAKPPKGEFVVVIEGGSPSEDMAVMDPDREEELRDFLLSQGLPVKSVAKALSIVTGRSKNDIYKDLIK